MKKNILSFLFAVVFVQFSFAQLECGSTIFAGQDFTMDCNTDCTTLEASMATYATSDGSDTSDYIIFRDFCLPEVDEPIPTFIDGDDDWTDTPIDLEFEFSFFGNIYDKILIGDNGVLTFEISEAISEGGSGYCPWSFDTAAPSPNLPVNAIFGAYHDLYTPAATVPGEVISYFSSGEAPYRMFVVDYNASPQFSCNSMLTTQRIILYETSNVISVSVTAKPVCDWNSGNAIIGIQNKSGTVAYVPGEATTPAGVTPVYEERNTAEDPSQDYPAWEITDIETWLFVPASYEFVVGGIPYDSPEEYLTWYNATPDSPNNGDVVGVGSSIEVCPTEDTQYKVEYSDGVEMPRTSLVWVYVEPSPTATQPENITNCSTIMGGTTAEFDLNALSSGIINGQTGVSVAYYSSMDDAEAGTGALTSPYTNTALTETIYASVSNNSGACYEITSFDISVAAVTANATTPLVACSPTAGSAEGSIDLASYEAEITGGQDVVLSYYLTEADAIAGTGALASTLYEGPSIDIYVRLENTESCFDVGVISITIQDTPLANEASDMAICNSGTGTTAEFDLGSQSDDIINGQTAVSVSYYETMDDAEAETNALPSLYTNITSPQTIYARITGDLGGCHDITTFTITASEVIATDVALGGCSPTQGSADGVYELTNIEDEVINGQTGITATYYTSLADATAASNELIDTLYEGPSQNFYVRLENELGCYDIAEIVLSVQPSPMVNAQTQEFLVCNEGNGIGIFNLQEALDTATGTQDNIVSATLHQSQEDANQNIAEINTEDVELAAQTLYIRLENTNGCTSYGSFNVEVENCPPVVPEAFSPNGDGANDVFTIHKLKTIYTDYKLSIYNRWGNLVYEGGDADAFWDGTVDDALIESDGATGTVYFYVLELNDGVHEPMKGTIYVNP